MATVQRGGKGSCWSVETTTVHHAAKRRSNGNTKAMVAANPEGVGAGTGRPHVSADVDGQGRAAVGNLRQEVTDIGRSCFPRVERGWFGDLVDGLTDECGMKGGWAQRSAMPGLRGCQTQL
jgi:hypothetical protein